MNILRVSLSLIAISCAALIGCSSPPATDDLGEIVYKLPTLPGTNQPYFLPELANPAPAASGQPE